MANFIGLATGQRPWIDITTGAIKTSPYYDGQIFHRLIHDFMIQGGDILGTGTGGPGFVIQDQYHSDLRHSGRYILSMAKSSLPNSTGSQFFITLGAPSHLDDKHSVFGEVITNTSLIDDFADPDLFPTTTGESPDTQINLDSVAISGPDFASFDLFDPSLELPTITGQTVTPDYAPDTNIFNLTWNRTPQTQFLVATSPDLTSLAPLGYVYSGDAESGYSLNITGVTTPKYFSRVTAIDYGILPNAPADLVSTGHNITLSDRAGTTLSLTFTGPRTGTWLHSDSSSGTFTLTDASDGATSSGAHIVNSSYPMQIPLYQIALDFDAPGGPNGWLALNIILSFHEPTSGWGEGVADIATFPFEESVLQSFTFTR